MTKNAEFDKYRYSGFGNGSYSQSLFSISIFDFGKNVVNCDIVNGY